MWFMIAMAVVSAVAAAKKSQAQAAQYKAQAQALDVQAQWTRFEGRQKALEYKKRASEELEKTLLYQARINAQAGAGLMDPFSGNPMGLKIQALDVGSTNYGMAKTNAHIVRAQAAAQAEMQINLAGQARMAAKSAKQSMLLGGAAAAGQTYYQYQQVSTPSSTGTTSGTG